MILGIGTDIVKMKRFHEVMEKTPSILKRVFTPNEIMIAGKLTNVKRYTYYAKRFAAKEAVSKACGTGIGKVISWQDIEISNLESGCPVATLSQNSTALLKKNFKAKRLHLFLSLSDEKDYTVAFAVLEKN